MIRAILVVSAMMIAFIDPGRASAGTAQTRGSTKIDLSPCTLPQVTGTPHCGVFKVLEDRTRPNGRVLPLKVVVLPARSPNKSKEPIFYFEGGPGEAATGAARYFEKSIFRESHDVVLIDQRGTGAGHALDCPFAGNDGNLQGFIDLIYPALKKCPAQLTAKADLRQYITPIAAMDVDEARQALGFDKINVYGASYGSRAALVYAKMFGEHVRAAYLAAPFPLEARSPLYQSANVQRAFDASVARCAADLSCGQAYPDPRSDLEQVKAALRRRPATVTIKHPVTGAPTDVVLTEWGFISGFMTMLYAAESPSTVPSLLRRARDGDLSDLTQRLVDSRRSSREVLHTGANAIVICNEDVRRIRPEEVEAATHGTFAGSFQVKSWMDMCRYWPIATYPSGFFDPFVSNIPTFIMSGTLDPVTPTPFGAILQRYFPNSIHLAVETGHKFNPNIGCFSKILTEFLDEGSVGNLDTGCIASEPGIKLVLAERTSRIASSDSAIAARLGSE